MGATSATPSERVTGFRAIFSAPTVYRRAQDAIGASRFRSTVIAEYLRVSPGEHILDIGCGTADILDHLPPCDYIGFDHSREYIAAAEQRFGHRASFISGSFDEVDVESLPPRTLAMAIGVLHHLDDAAVSEVLHLARSVLREGGRFVSVDPTYADGQHPIGRWLASRDRGQHVRRPDEVRTLVDTVFGSSTIEVRHDLLRVPYSHVIACARSAD